MFYVLPSSVVGPLLPSLLLLEYPHAFLVLFKALKTTRKSTCNICESTKKKKIKKVLNYSKHQSNRLVNHVGPLRLIPNHKQKTAKLLMQLEVGRNPLLLLAYNACKLGVFIFGNWAPIHFSLAKVKKDLYKMSG